MNITLAKRGFWYRGVNQNQRKHKPNKANTTESIKYGSMGNKLPTDDNVTAPMKKFPCKSVETFKKP